jgi:hypothetical protein
MYYIFLIYSSDVGHLELFSKLAFVISAAINMDVQEPLSDM